MNPFDFPKIDSDYLYATLKYMPLKAWQCLVRKMHSMDSQVKIEDYLKQPLSQFDLDVQGDPDTSLRIDQH